MTCGFFYLQLIQSHLSILHLDIPSPAPTVLPCFPISGNGECWPAFLCIAIFDLSALQIDNSREKILLRCALWHADIVTLTLYKALSQRTCLAILLDIDITARLKRVSIDRER